MLGGKQESWGHRFHFQGSEVFAQPYLSCQKHTTAQAKDGAQGLLISSVAWQATEPQSPHVLVQASAPWRWAP